MGWDNQTDEGVLGHDCASRNARKNAMKTRTPKGRKPRRMFCNSAASARAAETGEKA